MTTQSHSPYDRLSCTQQARRNHFSSTGSFTWSSQKDQALPPDRPEPTQAGAPWNSVKTGDVLAQTSGGDRAKPTVAICTWSIEVCRRDAQSRQSSQPQRRLDSEDMRVCNNPLCIPKRHLGQLFFPLIAGNHAAGVVQPHLDDVLTGGE